MIAFCKEFEIDSTLHAHILWLLAIERLLRASYLMPKKYFGIMERNIISIRKISLATKFFYRNPHIQNKFMSLFSMVLFLSWYHCHRILQLI